MQKLLVQYKEEVRQELDAILFYWIQYTPDKSYGGFVGKIDHENKIYPEAPKGSVLNSRILWAFSSAYNLTEQKEYLTIAERAFNFLLDYFIDKEHGGVYWTVDHKGAPLDTKKQIYALSFALYGLSEYFKASKSDGAKRAAIELYQIIVDKSYDKTYGGYLEAFTRNWEELSDLRLSSKDANEKKTMNTHLHVLEGFANLYRIWPNEVLKDQLAELVNIFLNHIIGPQNHLRLFFDEEWNSKGATISYGHDIEAAWLVQEAAELIGDDLLLVKVKKASLQLTEAAAKGLDSDGGLWYEYEPESYHLIRQKHWWPQAEAMVGFFNGWQISGDEKYLNQSLKTWGFVKDHMLDKKGGEWYWGVEADYSLMGKEDKVGIWKCPYHNGRACIEIINRITHILNTAV